MEDAAVVNVPAAFPRHVRNDPALDVVHLFGLIPARRKAQAIPAE
jgi:hypothetical protein